MSLLLLGVGATPPITGGGESFLVPVITAKDTSHIKLTFVVPVTLTGTPHYTVQENANAQAHTATLGGAKTVTIGFTAATGGGGTPTTVGATSHVVIPFHDPAIRGGGLYVSAGSIHIG